MAISALQQRLEANEEVDLLPADDEHNAQGPTTKGRPAAAEVKDTYISHRAAARAVHTVVMHACACSQIQLACVGARKL